uniref:Peptidase S1 domain-containing protein n=1 Tax=Anopheles stephensi TaxID=30069 RepID=A0A182XW56_ANOST
MSEYVQLGRAFSIRMQCRQKCTFLLLSLVQYSVYLNKIPVVGAIVGGESANDGEYPHMVALGRSCLYPDGGGCVGGYEWFCGGSLISDRFVLTAAHCAHVGMSNPPTVVQLGAQDLRQPALIVAVRAIVQHPGYGGILSYNDIALIELSSPITTIQPAYLWPSETLPENVPLIATGWGKVGHFEEPSMTLQRVHIPIVPNNQCNQLLYRNRRLRHGVLPTQLCAGDPHGGKDTCEGDSGGPLQMKLPLAGANGKASLYYIVGITSNGGICGTVNRPGLYTRVSSYVGWIEQVLQMTPDH